MMQHTKKLSVNRTPSSLELHIIKILKKEKIEFEREKTFQDLRGGRYRFDFYLPSFNILIEVDGKQHFVQNKHFYQSRKEFQKAQERDRKKNAYALANNISLYRIPFFHIEEINSFKDIKKSKYKVKTKWHNDEVIMP